MGVYEDADAGGLANASATAEIVCYCFRGEKCWRHFRLHSLDRRLHAIRSTDSELFSPV